MAEKTWTTKDVVLALDIKERKNTFDRWLQLGIARPSDRSRRRGYPSRWNARSIVALGLTLQLGKTGLNLTVAADIAEAVMTKAQDMASVPGSVASLIGVSDSVAIDMDTHEYYLDPWLLPEHFAVWGRDRQDIHITNIEILRERLATRLDVNEASLY